MKDPPRRLDLCVSKPPTISRMAVRVFCDLVCDKSTGDNGFAAECHSSRVYCS